MKGANYSATGNTFLVVDSREERLDDVTKHSIVIKNVGNNDGVISSKRASWISTTAMV